MPSLKILYCINTKPFAGDDIHVLCKILGIYRVLQICSVIPLAIHFYILKVTHDEFFCYDGETKITDGGNDVKDEGPDETKRRTWASTYIYLTLIYGVGDLVLLAAIWAAASVGTPTQTIDREKYLRPLIIFKLFIMNILLVTLITLGLTYVAVQRRDNYGCDEGTKTFQDTGWYALFCIIIVTHTMEFLVSPCIFVNRTIALSKKVYNIENTKSAKKLHRYCLAACLGGCLKVLTLLCCNKAAGSSDILFMNHGNLKDAVRALLDFFTEHGMIDAVFSDLWVAFKMLSRVQRENQVDAVNKTLAVLRKSRISRSLNRSRTPEGDFANETACRKATSLLVADIPGAVEYSDDAVTLGENSKDTEANFKEGAGLAIPNRRKDMMRRGSVLKLELQGDVYKLSERDLISAENESDTSILKDAVHFAKYADAVYGSIYDSLRAHIKTKSRNFDISNRFNFNDLDGDFCLTALGFRQTLLAYANFRNGIAETPYCVLVDKSINAIVISVRGTASLEDMVIDLQLTPSSVDNISRKCGFDGKNDFCHKGVLTRSDWIYDDIEEQGILSRLLTGKEPSYPGFKLVVTGHSLGAGCAAVLAIMYRQQFPTLKCFAFEPPGGLLSEGLADQCKDYVLSFVNNTDVIPRTSYENFERLRDNAFETLARIKVPKIELLKALQDPCSDDDLAHQNAKLLYRKYNVPKDTKFYSELERYRFAKSRRKSKNSCHLFLPGDILHIIKTSKVTGSSSDDAIEEKFIAQRADKHDFNEIVLSATMVADHGTESVIENLTSVVESLEKPHDDEENLVEVTLGRGRGTTEYTLKGVRSAENKPNFVCCSKPHGSQIFFPAVLATMALIFALSGNNYCSFVERETLVTTGNTTVEGIGYSVGLFTLRYKKEVNTTDPPSYEEEDYCSNFPATMPLDPYVYAARLFAGATCLIGAFAVTCLWFSTCLKLRRVVWRLMTFSLFLTTLFQGLVFMFYKSGLCTVLYLPNAGADESGTLIESTCSLGSSGRVAIVSAIFWFISGVLTINYPEKLDDDNDDDDNSQMEVSITTSTGGEVKHRTLHVDIEEDLQSENSEDTIPLPWLGCLCFCGYRVCCIILSVLGCGLFVFGVILLFDFLLDSGVASSWS